jgi:hypothetical protein
MATQNPALPPGQWVQYNVTTQNPRAAIPSPEEQGIGRIRQSFSRGDGQYYQVVWNPGSVNPKSALYHQDQLCALTQQEATQIIGNMNSGDYTPNEGVPGSNYQQPNVPVQAAPPSQQRPGMETL